MEYISGMKMGNIIERFLRDRSLFDASTYKQLYKEISNKVDKVESGDGKAKRYRYNESEVIKILKEHDEGQ